MAPLPDPVWKKVDPAQEPSPATAEGEYPCRSIGARHEGANEFLNHEAFCLANRHAARWQRNAGVPTVNEAKEDNLDIEIISVLGELWTPFAVQQRATGKLYGE
jgi:hypothetical protein